MPTDVPIPEIVYPKIQFSTTKKFFKKNLTKNATKGIINSCLSGRTQNYIDFADFRMNFTPNASFFLQENLDIISLMWYYIST